MKGTLKQLRVDLDLERVGERSAKAPKRSESEDAIVETHLGTRTTTLNSCDGGSVGERVGYMGWRRGNVQTLRGRIEGHQAVYSSTLVRCEARCFGVRGRFSVHGHV